MNKKIKMIELYNKVANNKDLPKQIRWEDMIWTLDEGRDYISEIGRTLGSNVRLDELNNYVEILEDNTEDKGYELLITIKNENNTEEIENIEELYLEKVHTIPPSIFLEETLLLCEDKINELVKAVNQIRKD